MTRLIDADKLEAYGTTVPKECNAEDYLSGARDVLEHIDAMPTVDAIPVRHGKWMPLPYDSGGYWKCSNCETPTEASGANVLYKYCPFCGARMDAERKEEFDCNDCYYSMQNCKDKTICCEDETALCDNFEPVVERKANGID